MKEETRQPSEENIDRAAERKSGPTAEAEQVYGNAYLHEKILRGMKQARAGLTTVHELAPGNTQES